MSSTRCLRVAALSCTGDTALLFAANFGHMGIVAALAQAGADLALCNNDGSSSFVVASAGHTACLAMLIRLSGDSASTFVSSSPPFTARD